MSQKDRLKIAGRQISDALTFDDVLLQPGYSDVLPKNTNITITFDEAIRNTDAFTSDICSYGYSHREQVGDCDGTSRRYWSVAQELYCRATVKSGSCCEEV